MAVVTISRQFGAGGKTLADAVAERLHYTCFGSEIIQMVAQKAKISTHWAEAMEKEAGGAFQKFISGLVPKTLIDRVIGNQRGYIDEEIYVDLLREIITKIAEGDNVVIIGRGSQYILGEREQTYHFLLVASREHRIRFIEKKFDLRPKQALQAVINDDKRRRNLYRKFHRTDFDKPDHYHAVLNMSRLSIEQATDIITGIVAG
jgi:cytidylate kinase